MVGTNPKTKLGLTFWFVGGAAFVLLAAAVVVGLGYWIGLRPDRRSDLPVAGPRTDPSAPPPRMIPFMGQGDRFDRLVTLREAHVADFEKGVVHVVGLQGIELSGPTPVRSAFGVKRIFAMNTEKGYTLIPRRKHEHKIGGQVFAASTHAIDTRGKDGGEYRIYLVNLGADPNNEDAPDDPKSLELAIVAFTRKDSKTGDETYLSGVMRFDPGKWIVCLLSIEGVAISDNPPLVSLDANVVVGSFDTKTGKPTAPVKVPARLAERLRPDLSNFEPHFMIEGILDSDKHAHVFLLNENLRPIALVSQSWLDARQKEK